MTIYFFLNDDFFYCSLCSNSFVNLELNSGSYLT